MGVVKLIDKEGKTHDLPALEGWRVMEILRDWGMFIPPRCGGSGECGMCHIKLSPEWKDKVPAPEEREAKMLPLLPMNDANSRLGCQILWNESLDGLTVALP
ncbi:MAG: 2Fe-2S iron-sulfur cluster-binding protein [Mangrovicoccus sp.]|nr:2Fe-2S iron-sulfur cluster-binding protein [Mangrovicoccus sp.]